MGREGEADTVCGFQRLEPQQIFPECCCVLGTIIGGIGRQVIIIKIDPKTPDIVLNTLHATTRFILTLLSLEMSNLEL